MDNHNTSPTQNQAQLTNADEIVTSWRDVDTRTFKGRWQLNRVIALRAGWRIIPVAYSEYRGQLYDIVTPEGRTIDAQFSEIGVRYYPFPEYTTDANAALALIPDTVSIRMNCSFSRDTGKPVYWVSLQHWNEYRAHDGYGTTRELALCLAWLAWSDAQPDAASGKAVQE